MVPTLARDLAPRRVNAVSPGVIDTPWWNDKPKELFTSASRQAPLGRAGLPAEVADAIRFLIGNAFVLLSFSDAVPAEAIRASLAPFERGERGDVPDEWLASHHETEHVAALHECGVVFTHEPGQGLRIQGGDAHYQDIAAVIATMEAHAVPAARFASSH